METRFEGVLIRLESHQHPLPIKLGCDRFSQVFSGIEQSRLAMTECISRRCKSL